MNDEQREKAELLAARNYFTVVNREKTDDGEYYYVASNPNLSGCVADGQTPEEAKQELAKARTDYIYYLLEDNLVVPEPGSYEVKIAPRPIEEYKNVPIQKSLIPHNGYIVEDLIPG